MEKDNENVITPEQARASLNEFYHKCCDEAKRLGIKDWIIGMSKDVTQEGLDVVPRVHGFRGHGNGTYAAQLIGCLEGSLRSVWEMQASNDAVRAFTNCKDVGSSNLGAKNSLKDQ